MSGTKVSGSLYSTSSVLEFDVSFWWRGGGSGGGGGGVSLSRYDHLLLLLLLMMMMMMRSIIWRMNKISFITSWKCIEIMTERERETFKLAFSNNFMLHHYCTCMGNLLHLALSELQLHASNVIL